ncbi:MAG: GH92 family glycosyl hydrolase [Bacteroidota bacterium]
MNRNPSIFAALFILLLPLGLYAQKSDLKLTDFVNPFIGTGPIDSNSLSGNNFPGAATPFGFVQLSPDTKDVPDDPCSGYDYNEKTIYGFSHTHLSGTGVPDLFDILFMPAEGDFRTDTNKANKTAGIYYSRYTHDKEWARPGYYQVNLLDYNINAELTATEHAGFHRYTFPQSNQSHILIDLNHKCKFWESARIWAQIKVLDNKTIEGYRIITGWTEGYRKIYFRAEFSKPFESNVMIDGEKKHENLNIVNGREGIKVLLNFNTAANEQILVKVGLSSVSIENARLNLSTEMPDWNFDRISANASAQWERELECIIVEGTKEQKEIFYTGLYHAFIQPNNIADINGDYPATNMTVRNASDKKHYSTFSLWDTYRAANPLYTLVQTKRTAGFINSMIRQYETYGFLPIWQLWGLENYCMIGNHAIPVITDAALKGVQGFDLEKAYQAVKASSTTDHVNSPFSAWEKYGYIPEDVVSQSVSITLEMAYDDWCVAQFAKKLGKSEDYEHFIKRSAFYKNLFDTKTHFFRAKNKTGNWLEPFDPLQYGANGNSPYTEGNAWQYLFYVPQDMNGLINLMGGRNAFCTKVDTFFTLKDMPSEKNGNASGFIGQYAHGNEPSHHAAYLYDFAGQPWKTQKYVSQVLNELYNNSTSGYPGNEDCGQMSSWYIFSSIGFYPVNPAGGVYAIGSPVLKSATIHLANGKIFSVAVKNPAKENVYIQSVKLNGKPYGKAYITQNDIVNGGTLEFVMGNQPNKEWGANIEDAPPAWGYPSDGN